MFATPEDSWRLMLYSLMISLGTPQIAEKFEIPLPGTLATRHSSLGTRHSELATRNSPLGTRHSELATRNSPLATCYWQLRISEFSTG